MRRIPSQLGLLVTAFVCVLALVACGSSAPVLQYVTITPQSASTPLAKTFAFTAQFYYSDGSIKDGTNLAVWGTSNAAIATIAAGGVATAVGTGTVNITASAAGTPGATATLTVTGAVTPMAVTTSSLPAGTVNNAYSSTTLTATGGVSPYTWAVTTGALPAGLSLSSAGVISGTPTTTTGSPFAFTVTATDSVTPADTATANLSIAVSTTTTSACGTGSESMLNGQYAFVLKGFDSSGNPALVGGILAFNGSGSVTSGTIDMNLNAGVQSIATLPAAGTYSVGSDQRGCMSIPVSSTATQNYSFSLGNITSGVAATAHVIDFDATGPFTSGTMYQQSGPFSDSSLNGTYAFGGSSIQNSAAPGAGGKFGVVGYVTFNGSGVVTGGAEDFNDNGTLDGSASNTTWPASPVAITGGSYTASANGRATLSLTVGGGTLNSVVYLVSTNHALIMTSDAQTTANIIAGESFLQSGAPFAANPLSGTFIGYDSGVGSTAGTTRTDIILLGPLTSGSSTLAGIQQRNDGSTFSSGAISGTYSVSSAGRLLVSGGGSHEPVLYLVSATQAFFLNSNGGVDSGFFESQSGGPFSSATPSGTYAYGAINSEGTGPTLNSGVAVFANPNISATEDDNSSGTLTPGGMQSFTYSVDATGLGELPVSPATSCTVSATSTTCQTLLYIISPTKAVFIDVTSKNPKIQIADK